MTPVQECTKCCGTGKLKDDSGKLVRCGNCGGTGKIVTQLSREVV
jgi:hypothetical protein